MYSLRLGGALVRLTQSAGRDAHPSYSPDGKQIAFQSPREGQHTNIYLMNADGSRQERITSHAGFAGVPVWSPDGKILAYQWRPVGEGAKWRLMLLSLAGDRTPRPMTDGSANDQVVELVTERPAHGLLFRSQRRQPAVCHEPRRRRCRPSDYHPRGGRPQRSRPMGRRSPSCPNGMGRRPGSTSCRLMAAACVASGSSGRETACRSFHQTAHACWPLLPTQPALRYGLCASPTDRRTGCHPAGTNSQSSNFQLPKELRSGWSGSSFTPLSLSALLESCPPSLVAVTAGDKLRRGLAVARSILRARRRGVGGWSCPLTPCSF